MTLAESDWIAQSVAGSATAFAKLVTGHQQAVRAFLRRLCGNWAEADDLAQEVFLDAWLNIRRFQPEHDFKVWLCGIAYHKFLASRRSFWRRLKRETAVVDEEFSSEATNVPVQDRDAWLDLRKAMVAFPIEQRAVLALCVAADWSHNEAANALGLPLGTVKSHIQRGRVQLLERLASYEPLARANRHE